MVGVEELRGLEGDGRGGILVWTDDGWLAAEIDEVIDEGDPRERHDPHRWDDSRVTVQSFTPLAPEGWATGYCQLVAWSDEGEWQDAKLRYGTEYDEESGGYPDLGESVGVRQVEPVSWTVVNEEREIWLEEMERALGTSVSTGTYQRAILAASLIRVAARTGWGEVWASYEMQDGEASLRGFVDWLGKSEFIDLVDNVGAQMWPVRGEIWDVSPRVMSRTLKLIQHFVGLDWTPSVVSASGGEEGVESGSPNRDEVSDETGRESDAGGLDGEVTFEPADR